MDTILNKKWSRPKCLIVCIFIILSWLCTPVLAATAAVTAKSAPINVVVAAIKLEDVPDYVSSLGSLAAVNVVTISSVADGRIKSINFQNGQPVGKGMPIVQLDDAQANAEYQKALSTLKLNTLNYNRSQKVVNISISEQQLAKLKSIVEQDQAEVNKQLALLHQTVLKAPFSGVLAAFQVHAGDYVSAGAAIVNLVDTTQLRVNYNIAESYFPRLKQNQTVKVTVSAYPKQIFYGTVNYISPSINKSTRTVALQALVPNSKNLLKPGMFVKLQQQISVTKGALVVPDQAILADIKGYYVYKVVGDKVAQTYVKIGLRTGGNAQILSGLKLGEKVVVQGQQKLQDGSAIAIITSTGQ